MNVSMNPVRTTSNSQNAACTPTYCFMKQEAKEVKTTTDSQNAACTPTYCFMHHVSVEKI